MSDTILLVDFENVGKIDLAAVPDGFVAALFFGAAQKAVPKEFLKAALKLRERFVSIDIEGQGKNALDFHARPIPHSIRQDSLCDPFEG